MEIEYYKVVQINGVLDIPDIGNCAIEANNDMGEYYYVVIDTYYGMSRMFKYGPINPDFEALPNSVTCSIEKLEYNPAKICNSVEKFINNQYAKITQAIEIDKETALDRCKDLISVMKTKGE